MSRIGKQPITILNSVNLEIHGQKIAVKGPKGELAYQLPSGLVLTHDKELLTVTPKKATAAGNVPALWGLWRSLLANAVEGVSTGFTRELELVGVGFRGQKKDEGLELQLGFSHPVFYQPPEGVTVALDNKTITVSGIDKQSVGQVAAEIRALRKPDRYKGKGIRYMNEVVHLKPGKTAKAVGAKA